LKFNCPNDKINLLLINLKDINEEDRNKIIKFMLLEINEICLPRILTYIRLYLEKELKKLSVDDNLKVNHSYYNNIIKVLDKIVNEIDDEIKTLKIILMLILFGSILGSSSDKYNKRIHRAKY